MDDGAKSPRFAPYFSNSGFYYVKNNIRTRFLMEKMLKSISEISFTHSHQVNLLNLFLFFLNPSILFGLFLFYFSLRVEIKSQYKCF
jgi:hypothetical protein